MNIKRATNNVEKGIYVASKPAPFSSYLPRKYKASEHLYLIYVDGKGNEQVIRGGMLNQDIVKNYSTEKGTRIETQRDVSIDKSYDNYDDGYGFKDRPYKKLNISEDKLDSEWKKMAKTAEKIEYSNIRYHNPMNNQPIQNSNSVIRTVLEENNYDYKKALPEQLKNRVPGYENNLFKEPRFSKEEEMDKYVFPNSKAAEKYHEQRRYKENMGEYRKEIAEISKEKKLEAANKNLDFVERTLGKESKITKFGSKNTFNQTPLPISEDEVKELMKTDAYNNKYNPNYEKVQKQVRKAFEALYPEKEANSSKGEQEDRNENPENYYIWKTVGDGRTRSSHAERDGEVFCWDNPPEGGHPGEDYGCRCEAEPYVPEGDNTKIKRQTPMMRYEDYDEDDEEEFENIIQTPQNNTRLQRINILDNIIKNTVKKRL